MMKAITWLASFTVGVAALSAPAFANTLEGWSTDLDKALETAKAQNKNVLVEFTGSDWCPPCIAMRKNVFSKKEFVDAASKNFILVELDFPQDKSKLSEETQKQNKELGDKYAIQGYPTILLTDAEGRPYAATGYQKGGPEKYVEHLDELRKNKAKRDEAFAAAEKAEGVEKAKALVAALDAMGLEDEMVANTYGDIAEQIKAADPKDETGFEKKAAVKKRLSDFQGELQELAGKQDMDGALALVDKTLEEGGFGPEQTLQMMMTRAVIFAQQSKFDEALKAIDEAKFAFPNDPMIPDIEGFRKRIEEAKTKAADQPEDQDEE